MSSKWGSSRRGLWTLAADCDCGAKGKYEGISAALCRRRAWRVAVAVEEQG